MTVLATARLSLRRVREDDAEAMFAMLSDPETMRYWSSLPHRDIEQTREWIAAMIALTPDMGDDFIIELEGRAIGKAGFHRFPEIGYALHRDHWGRGFAQEALEAIIERGFAVLKMTKMEADVDPRNDASLRLLRKLGFVEDGRAERTWLIGSEYCDSVYLSLKRETWRARSRSAS